jgi:hypothetical protein
MRWVERLSIVSVGVLSMTLSSGVAACSARHDAGRASEADGVMGADTPPSVGGVSATADDAGNADAVGPAVDSGDHGAGDDAGDSGKTAADSSAPTSSTTELPCGPGLSCTLSSQVCCVNRDQQGNTSYSCVGSGLECIGPTQTALSCNDSSNCSAGNICCLSDVFTVFAAVCLPSSACSNPGSQAQLCDPSAKTSDCPADAGPASTCSSQNVGRDWDLPSTYGTCGGQ